MDDTELDTKALGNVMRFIKNGDDYREEFTEIELTDYSDTELEFGYTLGRDRYYVRMRRDDIRRFMDDGIRLESQGAA